MFASYSRERVRWFVTFKFGAYLLRSCSSRRPFTPPGHWLVGSQVDPVAFYDVIHCDLRADNNIIFSQQRSRVAVIDFP
jgi:hypothetical protein